MTDEEKNMFTINENYLKLQGSYLFSTVAKKVAAYKSIHPDKTVISLGIAAACTCDYRGAAESGCRDGHKGRLSWLCTGAGL